MSTTEKSLSHTIGNTPLVRLSRLTLNHESGNRLYAKLEGNNPAGSVKDRPAYHMITQAAKRQDIQVGDRLVEATSGNTGIALAMNAASLGYQMTLIMPTNQTTERKKAMHIYGAELILVDEQSGMEGARDLALSLSKRGDGYLLNQFTNADNPAAHYYGTAPEIWRDTNGQITHFVATMGTTGTLTGCGRFFKEKNPTIEIIGVQPKDGAQIPGIRKWPQAYLPTFYDPSVVDRVVEVSEQQAKNHFYTLAQKEGLFCGLSTGGALSVALDITKNARDAVIVFIACDRGDRYLSLVDSP